MPLPDPDFSGDAARLRALIDASPLGLSCVEGGRFTLASRLVEEVTGYAAAALIGQTPRLLYFSDAEHEAAGLEIQEQFARTGKCRLEVRLRHRDGSEIWARLSGRPLDTARPEAGFGLIAEDITEQRRLEEGMRRHEARIRLLLDSTAEGIYGLDADGTCILCNRACLRMLGYADESDLIGRRIHDLIHHTRPDGTPYPLEECKSYAAFRHGEPMHADDEVFWRADGTSFPVEYWSYPMHDEGVVVGSVVTFLDISERKAAEAALRAGKQRLRALIDSIPDMAWLKDKEGRFLAANMPLAKYCRRPAAEIVGHLDAEVFPAAIARRYRADDEKVMASREASRFDERYSDQEGRSRWLEVIKVPIFEGDGKVIGTAGIARDITERHEMEARIHAYAEKLAEQNASLLKESRAKSDFLGTMQHELKTPLNAIIGFSELLVQGIPQPLPPEQQAFAQDVLDAGHQLLELINDILTYTRGESGELALNLEPLDARAFLHGCVEAFRPQAEAKKLELTLAVAAECGTFSADRQYLRKIVDNLLSNAVKFTPAGGQVAVTARLAADAECGVGAWTEPRRCLLIAVADTGIGIADKDAHRVFQPFIQLHSGLTRPVGGTGLGLVLSRRLAELLGGTLDFKSREGSGSIFTLTLPWHPATLNEQ